MNILIVTPLFPPDVAPPAPYVKELTKRLSTEHNVTVLAYGHLPESVAGANIRSVEKNQPLLWRLAAFTRTLYALARETEAIVIENGASTELPACLLGLTYRKKMYLHTSDTKVTYTGLRKVLYLTLERICAGKITTKLPPRRPEILPYKEQDVSAFAHYETAWSEHIRTFTSSL